MLAEQNAGHAHMSSTLILQLIYNDTYPAKNLDDEKVLQEPALCITLLL